jgi:hypothetical protein
MPQDRKPSRSQVAERDLLDDARVLVGRYHARNQRARALTPEQRKLWAEQIVALVEKLAHALAAEIGPPDAPTDAERRRIWLEQFVTGLRIPQPLEQDPPELRPPLQSWQRAFRSERR